MTPNNEIKTLLNEACASYFFSGYQLYVEGPGEIISLCGGTTGYWDEPRLVDSSTLFDIGSVTKAVAGTTLSALAIEKNILGLEDRVSRFIPRLVSSPLGKLTIQSLLAHSSGLVPWFAIHETYQGGDLIEWYLQHDQELLKHEIGEVTAYSDLGFVLLGKILETLFGAIADAVNDNIFKPLKISDVSFGPLKNLSVAQTEFRRGINYPLQGIVFDENAEAIGPAAHAGLFATATSLSSWAREWQRAYHGESSFLSSQTVRKFVKAVSAGSSWALGWDTKSEQGSSAGKLFSTLSFGHLGYPGCSVWIDPEIKGFAIFLCNRVHPSRVDQRIRKLRPKLHDLVAKHWQLEKK